MEESILVDQEVLSPHTGHGLRLRRGRINHGGLYRESSFNVSKFYQPVPVSHDEGEILAA